VAKDGVASSLTALRPARSPAGPRQQQRRLDRRFVVLDPSWNIRHRQTDATGDPKQHSDDGPMNGTSAMIATVSVTV
jgi:hypothetical protein